MGVALLYAYYMRAYCRAHVMSVHYIKSLKFSWWNFGEIDFIIKPLNINEM